MKYKKLILRMDVGFVTLLSLIECVFYLVYFNFIYHHDNHVAAGVISKSTLRYRNRANAISMVGQAISLMAQFWYILIVGILYAIFKGYLLREVAAMIKMIDFLIIPLIYIKTSEPIKKFINHQKQNWKQPDITQKNICLHRADAKSTPLISSDLHLLV